MKEIWKDVKDFEGHYQVSNFGRLRSLDRKIIFKNGRVCLYKGKIRKLNKSDNGYIVVGLFNKCNYRMVTLHRLIAETFIPNPDNLPEVNHKDENRLNNNVDNLEWCTHKYNNEYSHTMEKAYISKRKSVLQIDKYTNEIIAKFNSLTDAMNKTGIHKSYISHCCRGDNKTAGGYIWKFVEEK